MIERIHLEILRKIDQHGTLTEAAKALHLTQSALSHSIKKLESHLNLSLWRKQGRRLELNEAGKVLLKLAHSTLPLLERCESQLAQMSLGERGALRIGMECHPCYRWLLKVVKPYLAQWPMVELDVLQAFQFGGLAALLRQEIDILVTPDPIQRKGLIFIPVFDYELLLAVSQSHDYASRPSIQPAELADQTLLSYPVSIERLDIFNQFLLPAQHYPKKHRTIETTEIILELVSANRGVSAMPGWLLEEYQKELGIIGLRLGEGGIHKKIYLGIRESDRNIGYIDDFIDRAAQNKH